MTSSRLLSLPALALSLAIGGGLSACGSNPVGEEHDDHPVALVLLGAQGQAVVTIAEGPTVTGQIAVAMNATQTYTVAALSEDGDTLALDGDELQVRVSELPGIASLTVLGTNQLVVAGGAVAGSGSVRIDLLHEGHAELGASVQVVVQE